MKSYCLKKFFIFLYFCILIISSFSSFLTSSEFTNEFLNYEMHIHVQGIINARTGLEQGQIPLRTAPLLHNDYGTPFFQFYSPTFYTIAGIAYKYLFPENPFTALKFIVLTSVLIGGLFFYRAIFYLTHSPQIALLSSSVYVVSPHLFINIFGLAHIPESFAQGIIPVIFYYSIRIYFSQKFCAKYIICSIISWFFLLTSHLITFVYFSFFLGLFFLIYTIIHHEYFKQICFLGMAYCCSLLIGAYYIFPIGIYTKYFQINAHSYMYEGFFYLTRLPSLLSIIPSIPGQVYTEYGVSDPKNYETVGFPIMLGFGIISYILLFRKNLLRENLRSVAIAMLCVFSLAFFVTWAPFYFWKIVPHFLQIGQGPYRFLVQIMWMGTVLFSLAIFAIWNKKKFTITHTVLGLALILLCARPWFTLNYSDHQRSIQAPAMASNLEQQSNAYLIAADSLKILSDGSTLSVGDVSTNCSHNGKNTICYITALEKTNNIIQLPIFYYPDMLNIKLNGKKIAYFPVKFSNYVLAGIEVPEGKYKVESYFQGLVWANWISLSSCFILFLLALIYFIKFTFASLSIKNRGCGQCAPLILSTAFIQFLIFFIVFINTIGLFLTPVLRNNTSNLYATVSKHILDTNDWMNLFYNGQDWLDKPHFQFWMTAISYKLFGISAFSYTLPGFLFNLVGAFYTYLFAKHIFGQKIVGLLAALFYLSSLLLLNCALSVKQEAFLLGEIIPACYYWYLYNESTVINKKYLFLGSLFTACALMTKGPFVLFPIFSGLFAIWIFYKIRFSVKGFIHFCFKWFLALSLSMLFIFPELIALYLQFDLHPNKVVFGRTGVSGLRWFFIESQFGRFFNNGSIKRPEKAESFAHYFYYFHVFLWGYFPWIIMLPFAVWNAVKGICKPYIYLFGSFTPTFILFSITPFQMDMYINILIPFAAILCSQWAAQSKVVMQHPIATLTLPTLLMAFISLFLTFNFIQSARYNASYQIGEYLKSQEKLDLLDYNALGVKLEFYSPKNQYKQIVSADEINIQKKPYYLVIKNSQWNEIASRLEIKKNQYFLLHHFDDVSAHDYRKILLKKLISGNQYTKMHKTDILLIRMN